MTDMLTAPHAGTRHADVIEGLANLAAFLGTHPELPLGDADPFLRSVKGGTDEENRAEVDRIAAILGVTAADAVTGTHYGAARDFGAGVTYSAWTFTAAARDRHARHIAGVYAQAGVAA
jgi:hypothetical protein